MSLLYKSTRNGVRGVSASEAIVKGLASDGGLFIPEAMPKMDKSLEALAKLSYHDLAYEVMSLFYQDFTEEELRKCIDAAYDEKFDTKEVAPTVKVGDHYFLELFHGATIAFKDMALSILPHLMMTAAKKVGIKNDVVILTATSGDTGKAALAGFADVEGTKIVVFYPKDGVSPVQKKQMVTQVGDNTHVVGIEGNFDDAQNGVKAIFSDEAFNQQLKEQGYQLSSANSINIGRLIPQVVYYFYTYLSMVRMGEIESGQPLNVSVPTGNFGNILAAYYAKEIGLPLGKLICASNDNKVLFDFLQSGVYDKERDFILTTSPSMDILISSNLERLICAVSDHSDQTNDLMGQLTSQGQYEITDPMKAQMTDFYGQYATQDETKAYIQEVFERDGYLMDPHTAVGYGVYKKYQRETDDQTKTVIVSTASPYKFTHSTMSSLASQYADMDDFDLIDEMHKVSNVTIPEAIHEILESPIRHTAICTSDEMPAEVKAFLNVK